MKQHCSIAQAVWQAPKTVVQNFCMCIYTMLYTLTLVRCKAVPTATLNTMPAWTFRSLPALSRLMPSLNSRPMPKPMFFGRCSTRCPCFASCMQCSFASALCFNKCSTCWPSKQGCHCLSFYMQHCHVFLMHLYALDSEPKQMSKNAQPFTQCVCTRQCIMNDRMCT